MRRDERERKRELKILPSNCLGAAKPFPTSSPLPPLDKTSVGKRWLSRIHQNHSRKLWIEQFSLESSISEGGRSIDSLKYKRGRPVDTRGSAIPRTCFHARRVGFYTPPLHAVFRAHAVGNDRARESQSRGRTSKEEEGAGKGLLTGRMSPLRATVIRQSLSLSSQLKIYSPANKRQPRGERRRGGGETRWVTFEAKRDYFRRLESLAVRFIRFLEFAPRWKFLKIVQVSMEIKLTWSSSDEICNYAIFNATFNNRFRSCSLR